MAGDLPVKVCHEPTPSRPLAPPCRLYPAATQSPPPRVRGARIAGHRQRDGLPGAAGAARRKHRGCRRPQHHHADPRLLGRDVGADLVSGRERPSVAAEAGGRARPARDRGGGLRDLSHRTGVGRSGAAARVSLEPVPRSAAAAGGSGEGGGRGRGMGRDPRRLPQVFGADGIGVARRADPRSGLGVAAPGAALAAGDRRRLERLRDLRRPCRHARATRRRRDHLLPIGHDRRRRMDGGGAGPPRDGARRSGAAVDALDRRRGGVCDRRHRLAACHRRRWRPRALEEERARRPRDRPGRPRCGHSLGPGGIAAGRRLARDRARGRARQGWQQCVARGLRPRDGRTPLDRRHGADQLCHAAACDGGRPRARAHGR